MTSSTGMSHAEAEACWERALEWRRLHPSDPAEPSTALWTLVESVVWGERERVLRALPYAVNHPAYLRTVIEGRG